MKKSIALILCLVLIIAATCSVLAACDSADVTIYYMDGDTVLKTDKVKVGETFTLWTPTDDNAKFIGWYIDSDLTQIYNPDKVMAELKLYAKFEAKTYTVSINTNSNDTATIESKRVSVKYGEPYTLPEPSRTGYTFTGYTLELDDKTENFPISADKYPYNSSIRVDANWAINSYTVIFKDEDKVLDTQTADYGNKVSYSASKTGYDFKGWSDDDGNTYEANKPFEVTKDITYTAIFDAKTYTIKINANGGILEGAEAISPITVKYDEQYQLPTLTKRGYTFTGYTVNGSVFPMTDAYTIAGSIEVLATYIANPVTVTFVDAAADARTVTINQYAKVSAIDATAKAGYRFLHWSVEQNGEAFAFTTEIGEDTTLYAVYAPLTYTININANGGSLESAEAISPISVTYDAQYQLPTLIKRGYTFTGYTTLDGADFASNGIYTQVNNITVVATYTVNTVTVTFVDAGTDARTVTINQYAKVSALNATPKTGNTFTHWSTEQNGEGFDFDKEIEANITLYAVYDINTYHVTVENFDEQNQNVKYGAQFTLSVPTAEEYPEWAVAESFGGYKMGEQVLTPDESGAYTFTYTWTENITITAIFERNPLYAKSQVTVYKDTTKLAVIVIDNGTTVEENLDALDTAKEGYTFKGWSKVNGSNNEADAFDVKTVLTDETITIYAAYTANQYDAYIQYNGVTIETLHATFDGEYTLDENWFNTQYKGYQFNGLVYEGKTFPLSGTYTYARSIYVTANYSVITKDVTFYGVDSHNVTTVNQYGKVARPVDPDKAGYTFKGWSKTQQVGEAEYDQYDFDAEVADDISLYAWFTPNTYTVTLFDGNTKLGEYQFTYDAQYAIPAQAVAKRGYTFDGLVDGEQKAFAMSADQYKIAGDISVYAQYTPIEKTVTFKAEGYDDVTQTVNQYAKATAIDDPIKAGYTFKGWSKTQQVGEAEYDQYDFDAEVADDISLYAWFAPKQITVTVQVYDGTQRTYTVTYDGAALALHQYVDNARPGYTFMYYTRTDGSQFEGLVLADYDADLTLLELWKQDNQDALLVKKDGYYLERANVEDDFDYVFLTASRIEAANVQTIEVVNKTIAGGDEFFNVSYDNDTAIMDATQATGTFTLRITRTDGSVTERAAKMVKNASFVHGADYTAIWNGTETIQSGTANFQSARNAESVMAAGIDNFVFDLSITTNTGSYAAPQNGALSFANANMQVSVEVSDGAVYTPVAESLYTINQETGAITFSDTLKGSTVRVTLHAKYGLDTPDRTLTLALNGGKNVYNNLDLRKAYADLSVHEINVLRNITAELREDLEDYISGHGKSIQTISIGNATGNANDLVDEDTELTVDIGTPQNDYSHGVYTRLTTNNTDSIKVNGNYFAIDGSKLPYIDNSHDQYGASGSQWAKGDSFRVANVQIGIFLYANRFVDSDGGWHRYQGGNATIENLKVTGNNIPEYNDKAQDLGDGKLPILKMSCSYLGIVCRGGTMNLNNVTVSNTSIGVFTDGGVDASDNTKYALVVNMDKCRVEGSWANDIYLYNVGEFNITNTVLSKTAGGAAIAIDDKPHAEPLNPKVTLDYYSASHISNWVTGEEAWFRAYGESSTATMMKTNINNGVTSYGLTDLDKDKNRMNFAIFARSGGGSNEDWAGDDIKTPTIVINLTAVPVPVIQQLLQCDEATATAYSQGMLANGIGSWTGNLYNGEVQVYLKTSVGSGTGTMWVAIPLYVQGTEPTIQ